MVHLRHPFGLYVLFATEMWERFSFYCMAAVFMLYMKWEDNGHPFLQQNASLINGFYIGTVYFTPFLGGILADRKLGYRNAIILGAVIMGLGHLLLAVDLLGFFFAGLLALTLGNGLFKPTISTLVGKLYPPNDPRLDSAYTIFYMGINVGAFISPLVAGYLRVRYGFHVAFGAAGVGMGISLLVFLGCQRWLVFTDYRRPDKPVADDEKVSPDVQRHRNIALLILFVIVALFWMAFKQNSNTIPLWFKDSTDRTPPTWLAGFSALLDKNGQITTEYVSTLNPLFVILFSLPLAWLWTRLGRMGLEPSTPSKIGIGMGLAAVGFGVFLLGSLAGADQGERVSPGYLIGAFVLITLAELMLSPVGLSLVSKLSSPRSRTGWMGGWFAATAVGGYLSGIIGHFWTQWPHSVFFAVLVGTSLLALAILLAFHRRLLAAMRPVPPSWPSVTGSQAPPVASASESITT